MGFDVDWRHGLEHMWNKHHVSVEEAAEALADDERIIVDPDPASRSGVSARVIGYSPSAAAVLVIILVRREDKTRCLVGCNRLARQQHRTTHVLPPDRTEGQHR